MSPHLSFQSSAAALIGAAATLLSTALATAPAGAGCDDRPGTPNELRAVATQPTEIDLSWTNTTRLHEAPNMCFDITVSGGPENKSFGGGACQGNVAYGSRSNHLFRDLAPGTEYCFRMKARTAPGTQGCVSQIISAEVCATTPTQDAKPAQPTGTAPAQPPQEPKKVLMPRKCSVNVNLVVQQCLDADGNPSEYFPRTEIPGCGATKDEAEEVAIRSFSGCLKDEPEPDCCSYDPAETLISIGTCYCGMEAVEVQSFQQLPGAAVRLPKAIVPRVPSAIENLPDAGAIKKLPAPSGGSDTSKSAKTCPASKPVGTPPHCCAKGTEYKRGKCRAVVVNKPAECPEGMVLKRGACRLAGCPPGTIGKPPFCLSPKDAKQKLEQWGCPDGTIRVNGRCRARVPKPSRDEQADAPPPPPSSPPPSTGGSDDNIDYGGGGPTQPQGPR